MKKGQIAEGIVEKIVFPNKGIVNAEGEKVVVKNSIAGQKVRFSVNKMRKGKAEGRLLEVLEKSPLEVDSPCPHFGICGGCTYQTLPYEEQLKMKEAQVKELLDSVISDYEFEGIKRSPDQFAYRNKMEFSFGDEVKDGPLALGMHKRGSFYDIVSVQEDDRPFHSNFFLLTYLVSQAVKICLQCRRPQFDPWVGKISWRKKMAIYSSILAWILI